MARRPKRAEEMLSVSLRERQKPLQGATVGESARVERRQEGGMQFRILGPLEVERNGGLVTLGGAKQRAVLAVLLLRVNRVVSRDRLIEAVWGERAPETAYSALQGYVSALRRTLGADLIVTRAPGYVLEAAPTSVDLGEFETLVAEGSAALAAGDARRASERLREALDLWRGEPLADLDSVGFVQIERVRVEELRLSAIEERLDADLALGRQAELVAELHGLVREHPLRERLRAQLMLALYRSGRQAEALDVYQQGRRLLAQELGLEPGEGLKRLERAILDHDPALGAPPRAGPQGAPTRRRTPSRRALVSAVAIVVVGGVAAGLAVTLTQGGGELPAVRPDSLAVIDTRTNRLAKDVPIDGLPVAVAANGRGVYVASERDGIVWLIDPATRQVVRKIGVGADVHDLALGFGSVWLADGTDGTVTRIDSQLHSLQRIPLGQPGGDAPAFWIATGAGAVWVTHGDALVKIDPATNRVVETLPIPSPAGLATGLGAVWVATSQQLDEVSPTARAVVHHYPLPGFVAAPTVGRRVVWSIVYHDTGEVWRFGDNLATAAIVPRVGRYPLDLAVTRDAVWTVDAQGLVSRIDPTATRVVKTIRTAPTIRSSLAVADGDLWVAVQGPR
jgi:YVTN family beta-propeller protein